MKRRKEGEKMTQSKFGYAKLPVADLERQGTRRL